MEPGGGMTPGPDTEQASAPGSESSNGLARSGGSAKAGLRRSSMSSMSPALASR